MKSSHCLTARKIALALFAAFYFTVPLTGCAVLHHAQVGDIDNSPGFVKKPFDIKVSETGVNLREAAQIGKHFMSHQDGKNMEQIAGLIGLFQMGPHTGNGVFSKDYAREVVQVIYEKCPSGKVTGLVSVRETRKYPVVSGEIVKVTGYCLIPKEG